MARVAGVDIPNEKNVNIALTSIFGIGRSTADKIVKAVKVESLSKVKDVTEDKLQDLRDIIER